MKSESSRKKIANQRLRISKSLKLFSGNYNFARVRTYKIRFSTRHTISVAFRKFTTQPKNRSKATKQYVIAFRFLGLKEIAFSTKSKNKKSAVLFTPHSFLRKSSSVCITAGLAGIIYFGLQVSGIAHTTPPFVEAQSLEFTNVVEDKEVNVDDNSDIHMPESIPVNITIPSIGVDADVQKVGLQDNGTIETPEVFSDIVGWYQYGPTPGEIGPSVLVGHVDSYKGPSIFWNLGKLQAGDNIHIKREDGTNAQFKVTEKVSYNHKNFDTEAVYGDIDHPGLRVITCSGVFNHLTGRYTHNTVIFAVLE